MTNRWIVVFLFLSFLQSTWYASLLKNEQQINDISARMAENPISFFSYQDSLLADIKEEIETWSAIDNIRYETGLEAEMRMIKKYALAEVVVLDSSNVLPSSITFTPNGKTFQFSHLANLQEITARYPAQLFISYFETQLPKDLQLRTYQKKISLYINWIFGILFTLVTFFMIRYIDIKNEEYWRIFHRAGGNIKKRSVYLWRLEFGLLLGLCFISVGFYWGVPHFFNVKLSSMNVVLPLAFFSVASIMENLWRRN